jgi:predicted phosphoadenosine phosphosulfate sulfurtransferase
LYSGRVPSWKAVAFALLRNDLHLRALGFSVPEPPWFQELCPKQDENDPSQLNMFEVDL